MRYKSFRIQNFKGIKDTTVEFGSIAGASVFAFVGLNESGKTTVLEAIHSFSPDAATSELLGGDEESGVPYADRVPRHQISTFSDDVKVTATVLLSAKDKEKAAKYLLDTHELTIDIDSIPEELIFSRVQRFRNGDFVEKFFTLHNKFEVKSLKGRKYRVPTNEENLKIRTAFFRLTPDIAYFPTFVFNFPTTIFLTERGTEVDRFYRRVFQDILDYDNQGHRIDRDIVSRVRSDEMTLAWVPFFSAWTQHADRNKIEHVMDRASAAVTKLVFGRWNRIFREDAGGKDVLISYEVVEGEVEDSKGVKTKTDKHDVLIKFQIKDRTRRFNVNDRSLGFRWFFAFMLFTQFRVARKSSRSLLFLFDEPASNLHAAAQQKLIECFPEIATGEHMLAYSTHSHYMIEPKWLEQTFIVTNRSDSPQSSLLDEASLDDESLDVKVATYRSFVNNNPSQISYFQPILDRLEVVPSRFDLQKSSAVVEGKSDYYIIRYASKLFNSNEVPILPGTGAGTFSALASLHAGWGLNLLFICDDDKQGRTESARYVTDFGIDPRRVATLSELVAGLKQIEDLLDEEAMRAISVSLGLKEAPTKAQISRFFQERLACNEFVALSPHFERTAKALLTAIHARLGN